MGIVFKETAKDYYLLVNRPELAKRAEELGYEGVMLFTDDDFDKEDIEHIINADKAVVRISFNEGSSGANMRRSRFKDTDLM